ncbi:MAG: hypothetical protein K6B70_00130 [Clostridia bacterium]|nr:hypothetical protein [Clostridia bacterium]
MYEVFIDGRGSTSNGEQFLKKVKFDEVTKVIVKLQSSPPGGVADVIFVFKDNFQFTISNSFGIGYKGTGPTELYYILTGKLGVDSEEAKKLFVPNTYELTFEIKHD